MGDVKQLSSLLCLYDVHILSITMYPFLSVLNFILLQLGYQCKVLGSNVDPFSWTT